MISPIHILILHSAFCILHSAFYIILYSILPAVKISCYFLSDGVE